MLSLVPEKVDLKALPKWVVENYPERQRDQEDWLLRYYFHERWNGKADSIEDQKLLARAVAEAGMRALDNSLELGEIIDQTTLSLFLRAHKENWLQYAEVEDLLEFLNDRLAKYQDYQANHNIRTGNVIETRNLIAVVETLVDMGVPKEQIIPIRNNLSKAKYASGGMKEILMSTLSPQEKQEGVLSILKEVVDPDISVRKFLSNRAEKNRQMVNAAPMLEGKFSVIREMDILTIESPTRAQTKAIQYALNGIVDTWSVLDPGTFIQSFTEQLQTKGKLRPTRLIVEKDIPYLTQGGEGVMLPTPEYFNDLIFAEIGHCGSLIDQILDEANRQVFAKVPIFRFGPRLKTEDLFKYIENTFQFERHLRKNPLIDLANAVMSFYSYPVEIEKLYKVHGWGLSWTEGEQLQICISLA